MAELSTRRSHYHILGVGSIGTLLAYHLAKKGHKVTLIFKRPSKTQDFIANGNKIGLVESYKLKTLASLASQEVKSSSTLLNVKYQNGYKSLTSNFSNESSLFLKTPDYSSIEKAPDIQKGEQNNEDLIQKLIITTKAHQTLEAIDCVSSKLSSTPTFIFIQNGMGIVNEVSDFFVSKHKSINPFYVLGTTTHGAMPTKFPFVYNHTGFGSTFISYYPLKKKDSDLCTDSVGNPYLGCINDLINLDLSILNIPHEELYEKLLIKLSVSAVLNPITALMQCKNGDVYIKAKDIDPDLFTNMCKEISEIYRLAHNGKQYTWSSSENIQKNILNVANLTQNNYSSMCMDLLNGNSTEIDYINGYLVNLAKRYNIDSKFNTMMYNQIKNYKAKIKTV
ncbi:hypothetical protein BB561_001805 [Smittium simulii]|uniref:2-dehydropantoate 2-reductase n=1 Tax=Smittium simulii TaxID=133385 RepID=A0A2T9YT03_9FUNG|nr:hypothetical protein BB561_001805 [Smittium simulii]